ncbi:MAG: hypothetical protein HEQ16_14910 [Bosea sp.]|jgi:hypothetical protein|nr:hypothetical protein [Bosea sp. (in: a-proteobacteria)]
MKHMASDSISNRTAQLAYLAEDKQLVDLIWKISALPEEARLIVSLMVSHLSDVEKVRKAA